MIYHGIPEREAHTISPDEDLSATVEWLRWRGYRAAPVPGGVVFSRKGDPAMLAVVGDVLVDVGDQVRIE